MTDNIAMCYHQGSCYHFALTALYTLCRPEVFCMTSSNTEHLIHPPINFLIIPADALPMLNLPLFRMFMATCEENEGIFRRKCCHKLLLRPQRLLPLCSVLVLSWVSLGCTLGHLPCTGSSALSSTAIMVQNWAFRVSWAAPNCSRYTHLLLSLSTACTVLAVENRRHCPDSIQKFC